jgi:acetyl/propionyl-CoA carboxylase alpha subunit
MTTTSTTAIDGASDGATQGTAGGRTTGSATRTPIRTLLVANRGEIARRVIRTARDMGIRTVAVYSEPDRDALHVLEADAAVPLGGSTSAESYLDADKVLAAARRSGADAIHPGYGFLSENPAFAEAVNAAGLVWVGPTADQIRAMALKVESKTLVGAAGLPLVPGAELAADVSDDDLITAGAGVGYPLLVKASAGGGGKGMRVVDAPADLVEGVAAARREATSAFGDGTVFLERYLRGARHVEVQVFGDRHGNVVHLVERECSIQRRHQKVVEEAPSPGITEATRAQMHAAAVAAARAIAYEGAGTVEFLVFGAGEAQEFFFLEMNTRLQVEHPVTEEITGLDLVRWQLLVAQGEPLPLAQDEIEPHGHAIEVRLYAEDPANGYLPNTGLLERFDLADERLRVDTGVREGDEVTAFYDPMLAKVIAHGATRDEAAARLAAGLRAAQVHGVVTNRDSLVAVLEHPDFLAGATTTSFLDEHPEVLAPQLPDARRADHLVAAALAQEALARLEVLGTPAAATVFAPSGWSNLPAVTATWRLRTAAGDEVDVLLRHLRGDEIEVSLRDADGTTTVLDEPRYRATVDIASDGVLVDLERHERLLAEVAVYDRGGVLGGNGGVGVAPAAVHVDDGLWSSTLDALPRFADAAGESGARGPSTPVPGTVTVVSVAPGDAVVAGQTLVVLEAMKMEHRITADADGIVAEVLVEQGQSVDAHQVVVVLEVATDG